MLFELESVEQDNIGRIYNFTDASYYSVTTILSVTATDKTGLEDWKNKLGDKKASAAIKKASRLGNDFHLLGENYLLNKQLPLVTRTPTTIFKEIKPILQDNIDEVIAVEATLKSDMYKLAGRVDAVVIWKGKLAILDFKLLNNSDRIWLDDYWIQTTIYANCWYEMYGQMPKLCILVIGNKKTLKGLHYKGKPKLWEKRMERRITKFHSMIL